jgi:hypothetical protein
MRPTLGNTGGRTALRYRCNLVICCTPQPEDCE